MLSYDHSEIISLEIIESVIVISVFLQKLVLSPFQRLLLSEENVWTTHAGDNLGSCVLLVSISPLFLIDW